MSTLEDISGYNDDVLKACVRMMDSKALLTRSGWTHRFPEITHDVLDRMIGFNLITEWGPSEWSLTPKGTAVAQAALQLKPTTMKQ